MQDLKVKHHISGNFYRLTDDRILNTSGGYIMEDKDLPVTMRFKKSAGGFQFCDVKSEFPTEIGTKFITAELVVDLKRSKSGKTEYVIFENFDGINSGSCKGLHSWMPRMDYGFERNGMYLLFLEVNPNYPSNLKIIKTKRLCHKQTGEGH